MSTFSPTNITDSNLVLKERNHGIKIKYSTHQYSIRLHNLGNWLMVQNTGEAYRGNLDHIYKSAETDTSPWDSCNCWDTQTDCSRRRSIPGYTGTFHLSNICHYLSSSQGTENTCKCHTNMPLKRSFFTFIYVSQCSY